MIDPLQQKHILFVDDDDSVLRGMRRVLHGMRDSWDVEFAQSAREALDLMAAKPVDLLIADMQMPGMSGSELLAIACRLYPRVIRFALSGYTDNEILLKAVGLSHQFYTKPCNADVLKSAIIKVLHFQNVICGESMQSMVAAVQTLPVLPEHHEALSEILSRRQVTIREIAAIVEQDVAMAAKVFHLANWDYFAPQRGIRNVERAVQNLGVDFLRKVAFKTGLFQPCPDHVLERFDLRNLFAHSVYVSTLAEAAARTMSPDDKVADDARIAGLLHDIGKMVLINGFGDEYTQVLKKHRSSNTSLQKLERQAFDVTHADVGGALLILWGFPWHVVEAVTFHHRPQKTDLASYDTVMSVHMGDCMAHHAPDGNHSAETSDEETVDALSAASKGDER
jgi:putative nucleotidyltransferase with HDIG domain